MDTIRKGDRVDVVFEYTDVEFNVEIIMEATPEEPFWNCKREDGTLLNIYHYTKMVKRQAKK